MKRTSLSPKRKRKPTRVYQVVDGVRIYPDGREVCTGTAAGVREYDQRTCLMAYRQLGRCAICKRHMIRPTFDHESGRGMGGGLQDDRVWKADGAPQNAALCLTCNTNKGSRRYAWQQGEYLPLLKEVAA